MFTFFRLFILHNAINLFWNDKRFQRATRHTFGHLFTGWFVRLHDTNPQIHSNARPIRRLSLHGNGSIIRDALLRSSAHRFYARQVPTRLQLPEESATEARSHVHGHPVGLLRRSVGCQDQRNDFHFFPTDGKLFISKNILYSDITQRFPPILFVFSWWLWSLSEKPWTLSLPEKSCTFWTRLSHHSAGVRTHRKWK